MTSAAQNLSSPVGVIAGGGAMPFAVADSLASRGISTVILALKGACDPAGVARFRHHWISVGQLGKTARLLRSEGCREVMFIGSLARPSLSEIRLDWGALRAMGDVVAAFRGGDDHLLSGIGRIFERGGRFKPEVGIPTQEEDNGRPRTRLSDRGLGTQNRTDPTFIAGMVGMIRAAQGRGLCSAGPAGGRICPATYIKCPKMA